MTDQKISQLANNVDVISTDLLPIVQNATTTPVSRKVSIASMAELFSNWIDDSNTWTYVNATTFIVSGDARNRFSIGTKIKLVQGVLKYFYVVGVSFNGSATTVTVTGGSDYALSSSTIYGASYSYASNPKDFPHWFNYTATVSGATGSAGTYAEDLVISRFSIFGRTCHWHVRKRITNLGSWSGNILIALPITASANMAGEISGNGILVAQFTNPATGSRGFLEYSSNPLLADFLNSVAGSAVVWSQAAVNDWISINDTYEI